MNRIYVRSIFAGLVLLVLTSALGALEIKLASLAPEQSPWGAALNQMAVEWQRLSGGDIRLRIYHNAIAGDENDALRKLRIGQLQAAVLTSAGMKQVVPGAFSVSVPFMIRSRDALDYVMDRITPDLEEDFRESRLHVLAWTQVGWVHFFSKNPVVYPEDLKSQRLATDPADQELQQAFKVMGYRPIPMPQPDLLPSLNSGLVDAFYTSPLVAAGYQWFGLAPNMLALKVAPFLGVIVITDSAWRRIDDDLKDALLRSAHGMATRIENEILGLEEEAIAAMRRYGLHVQEVTPEIEEVWVRDVARYSDSVLEAFDPEMTQRVRDILAEYGR